MGTVEIKSVEDAEKFFNEMLTCGVRYHNVANYDDLLQVMGKIE